MNRTTRINRAQRADRKQIISRFGELPEPDSIRVQEHPEGFRIMHHGEQLLPWRCFPDRFRAWGWYCTIFHGPIEAIVNVPAQQEPAQ